jgi:hypothetical protein
MTGAYGRPHMRRKRIALEAMTPGEPCPGCRRPMWHWQRLDYDHIDPLVLGGDPDGPKRLMHATCNRSRGAALGNRLRGRAIARRPRRRPRIERW